MLLLLFQVSGGLVRTTAPKSSGSCAETSKGYTVLHSMLLQIQPLGYTNCARQLDSALVM